MIVVSAPVRFGQEKVFSSWLSFAGVEEWGGREQTRKGVEQLLRAVSCARPMGLGSMPFGGALTWRGHVSNSASSKGAADFTSRLEGTFTAVESASNPQVLVPVGTGTDTQKKKA